jgi:LPXTG-motif cell wall-anchored protein
MNRLNNSRGRTFKQYLSMILILTLVLSLFPFYTAKGNAASIISFNPIPEDIGAYNGQPLSDIAPVGMSHIAIWSVDDANGQWQWFSGTQWLNISDRLSPGSALILPTTTLVRFSATNHWNGKTSFEYSHFNSGNAADQANYESEMRTAEITVTPVADAPYLTEIGGNNYLGFVKPNAYAVYPSMDIYSNSFTFESWVKIPYDMNAWERIFDTSFGPDNFNIHLAFEGGTRRLVLEALPQKGPRISTYIVKTTAEFPRNQWVHVAAVYNHEQKQAYIYWNGVLRAQGSMDLTNMSNASSINGSIPRPNNFLGKSTWNQDGYFKGGMKHVRFWNKAKLQSEIINEMSTVLAQTKPKLLTQYVLGEGTGITAASSGSVTQALQVNDTTWLTEDGFIYDVTGTVGSTRVKDFTIWDVDGDDVNTITATAVSSNHSILPDSSIQVTGTGADRKIIMRPNQVGTTTITVTLNDGVQSYSDSFNLNVTSLPPGQELDEPALPNLESIKASDSITVGVEDTILPFTAGDFKTLNGSFNEVKITSLPPVDKGVLRLNNAAVNINDSIAAANLGNLTFTPAANWNGSTSFKWLALGMNSVWSNEATNTINVNPVNDTPSVPGNFTEIPNEVPFKIGSSVNAEFGPSNDVDFDLLTYVLEFYDGSSWNEIRNSNETYYSYNLPLGLETNSAQFRVKAKDPSGAASNYTNSNIFAVDTKAPSLKNIVMTTSNPDSTKAKVGDVITLSFEATEALKPAPTVVIAGNEVTPTFKDGKWTAEYTLKDSDTEGKILLSIDYEDNAGNKGPQVTATTDNNTINLDKGKPVITLIGKESIILEAGTKYEDEGATAFDKIDGDITSQIQVQNPVNKDVPGDYKVTYNVVDSSGNHAEEVVRQVKVIEKIRAISVNGTVTEQETGKVIDGAKVSIRDLNGKVIKETTSSADGDYHFTNINLGKYKLVVEKDGYSRNTIEFIAKPNTLTDHSMTVNAQLVTFKISFTANPNSIVGDGKQSTALQIEVLDKNNVPLEGLDVEFEAPMGTFPNDRFAKTDKNGKSSTVYQAAKLEGTDSKEIVVKAKVKDPVRNLYAEQQIIVTFEPSSIEGVVLDNNTKQPVNGAEIVVSQDFDGDGIVDFYAKMITGADGKYKMAVPKGNMDYDVSITKPVKIGNKEVPLTFHQTSKVGAISGAGNENYPSVNTVAGLVLTKDTDGSITPLPNSKNFKIEIFDKDKFEVTNGAIVEEEAQFSSSIANAASDKGSFQSEGLEKGKDYTAAVTYTFESGEKIVVGTADLEVKEDGQMTISTILIDPYGTITDAQTGKVIEGADVRLYYANTARNIAGGKTPDTEVRLPLLEGFEPANNANPQVSDREGQYAYMVFPTSDYYVKVVKSGFKTYVSPTISVEYEIVKHDIVMTPEEKPATPDSLVEKPTIDKTPLKGEYALSGKMVAKNYEDTSWKKYQDALKKAKSVLDDPNATQAEIDAALKQLNEAKAALVKAPVVEKKGENLPNTATDMYNWLLFGTAVLVSGIVMIIRRRRRA